MVTACVTGLELDEAITVVGKGNNTKVAKQDAAEQLLDNPELKIAQVQGEAKSRQESMPSQTNPKGQLGEAMQKARLPEPGYKTDRSGPPHQSVFSTEVTVRLPHETLVVTGREMRSKKDAEHSAAAAALEESSLARYVKPGVMAAGLLERLAVA